MIAAMLELIDLTYQSRGLGPLSLSLERGQVIMLCGPSGSGKSTLCQLLLGDLDPDQGMVQWEAGVRCGFLGGDVESQLLGGTVAQELELSRRASVGSPSPAWRALQSQVMERFATRMGEDPHRLSRGEQQILLLSSLLVGPYSCLILDEGLSGLDEFAFEAFCRFLREVAHAGGLIIAVSHEARLLPWTDRVLGLNAGELRLDCSTSALAWEDFGSVQLWPGVIVPGAPEEKVWEGQPELSWEFPGLGSRGDGTHIVLPDPLSRTLAAGEALALAGVSGSGKSRLLRDLCFARELEPAYRVMLTDNPSVMLCRRTVLAEVTVSQEHGRSRGMTIGELDLPEDWLERSPRALSTGQRKLVACRCLLLQAPDLLFLEEPFSGLDSQLRTTLELWLREYLRSGGRLVFTTHHPDEMCLYPDTLMVVEGGRPVWEGNDRMEFMSQPDLRLGQPGFVRAVSGGAEIS